MNEKLIILPQKGRVIFVGDTHGDIEATKKVIENYLDEKTRIIFLGDYVDRGRHSRENIDYLLKLKKENKNVILLMGNHEGYYTRKFFPSNFWLSLRGKEFEKYSKEFSNLPLAVSVGNIIALHGALPDIKSIGEINQIEEGSEEWRAITWGDFIDKEGEKFSTSLDRLRFGRNYFSRVMDKLKKNVLIRSHDPYAKEKMFDNRCLTIFTSNAYGRERKIAIVDAAKKIKTADDIELVEI